MWKTYLAGDGARYYIGLDGNSLRSVRNAADYDAEFPDLSDRVQWAIRKSNSILNSLSRLAAPPTSS